MSIDHELVIRSAMPADVPPILALRARSLRQLGGMHDDRPTLESVLDAGTLPPELRRFGRYRVALRRGRLVGAGGWVESGPGTPQPFQAAGKPAGPPAAVIRAVYVDPDHARQGIGRALMAAIEANAVASGKDRAELLASRMAVRFFSRLGYGMGGPLALAMADGRLVEVFAMAKPLAAPAALQLSLPRPAAGFSAAA